MPDIDPIGRPAGRRALVIITWAACVVFIVYAGCFLYFFVDDEAIPLVYAHNLVRGRGLSYTMLEGRVEGYSDFLHVLWSAALMVVTRGLGLSRLAPLLVGKAVSMIAGLLLIVWTSRAIARAGLRIPAAIAGLGFLCLAGPLAVWSASSLETVAVALTVLLFALAAWQGDFAPAVILGILIALERIDGPVYSACALLAALAADPGAWRRTARIAALTGLLVVAYHGWRFAYFGSLLSAPLESKVLFRLAAPPHIVSKIPQIAYLPGLLSVYGWIGAAALAAAAVAAARNAGGRAALAMLVLLGLYAERVDDWMFGWRFTVAMAPFAAIVFAIAVDRLPRRGAALAAAAICLWSVASAYTFATLYTTSEGRPIFWLSPRGGETAWLGRYAELLASARQIMRAGDRIAFNQAGLLPYALDLENIDDLGICSRFVARLPTTDIVYTGVGRYSPLTNDPVVRTAHAYLLYQNVKFLVTPIDLVRKANRGTVPDRLLDDAFSRVPDEALRDNVIYQRTGKATDDFARNPAAFTENVAHYSRVVRASIDGRALTDAEIGPQLPFLRELNFVRHFTHSLTIDVTFAATDEDIHDVYINGVWATSPAKMSLVLNSQAGRPVYSTGVDITPTNARVLLPVPAGTRASGMSIVIEASGDDNLSLADLRIEGQTDALHHYIRRNLRFPAPGW